MQTSPKQYFYLTHLVSKWHCQRLHASSSLHTKHTVTCLFLLMVLQSQDLLPPTSVSLSGLPKLALVLLWLLKLGPHCQTTHTATSEKSFLLLSLLLFLDPQVTHIENTFSGHQSLALDWLKGHLVRFARKCIVDQKVPVGRLPTPLHTLALAKEMLQALMLLLFTQKAG